MYAASYTVVLLLILTVAASAVRVDTLPMVEPPRVLVETALEVPYTWLDFFLARTLTEYVVFGVSEESVVFALVPAVVENCVQFVPPSVLYCQMSAVAEDVALILNPLAVMFEALHETVGAVLSRASKSMVVDAVMVPMLVPL